MSREEEIEKVMLSVENCRKCDLWKTRKKPVFGEGSIDTDVLFVGEAPGCNEDLQGRPFVGKAGKILGELLESAGLKRKEVYIANIIKCHPVSLSFIKHSICINCKYFEKCYQNIFKY